MPAQVYTATKCPNRNNLPTQRSRHAAEPWSLARLALPVLKTSEATVSALMGKCMRKTAHKVTNGAGDQQAISRAQGRQTRVPALLNAPLYPETGHLPQEEYCYWYPQSLVQIAMGHSAARNVNPNRPTFQNSKFSDSHLKSVQLLMSSSTSSSSLSPPSSSLSTNASCFDVFHHISYQTPTFLQRPRFSTNNRRVPTKPANLTLATREFTHLFAVVIFLRSCPACQVP